MTEVKLQKALQDAGIDSRRRIRQLIHEGKIQVNSRVVKDPNFPVDTGKDVVRLDRKTLNLKPQHKVYYLLNKPLGVVSTLDDPEGRPTIKDYIKGIKERIYPVGRLDFNSEGLMLLTNDGDLANHIISPRNEIPKHYRVKLKGVLTQEEIGKLKTKGMHIEGSRVKPLRIDVIKKTRQNNCWATVTIVEGKKHVVRKMFRYIGHPVDKLQRTAIGTFRLKRLPRGHWRALTPQELEEFKTTHPY